MTHYDLVEDFSRLLWLVLLLSLPVVVATAFVSLVLAVIQAVTQIQDQTLQFLIKLLTACAVLVLSYRWMGENLVAYIELMFRQIGETGR